MLQLPALYPITDATRPEPLADQVRRLGEAGFSVVQFRGKLLQVSEQYDQLKRALETSKVNGGWPRIVLNDRPDLAMVLASEGLAPWGLHLGQEDLPHALAAQLPGLASLHMGASTHQPSEWEGVRAPVDHAGVGPFRATGTKSDHAAPIGFEGLSAGCAALRRADVAPIAIGGLKPDDFAACFQAGAESVALVSAVHQSTDPASLGWAAQHARWKARPPFHRGQGIALVGPSGAGKTALARELAAQLGLPVLDLDQHIEARLGHSIAQLFEQSGEAAFRTLERDTLPTLLTQPAVIALGAGAWQQPEIRTALQSAGWAALWLADPPAHTWERVAKDPQRPLAQDRETYFGRCTERFSAWSECPSVSSFGRSAQALAEALVGSRC